jgi:hypothetical protein
MAAWVMTEHSDRIATLHYFSRNARDSAVVLLDVEIILVHAQKSFMQRLPVVNKRFEKFRRHWELPT